MYRLLALTLAFLAACSPRTAPIEREAGEGFAVRGVIEGFYGTPWTHEARLDVLRFMGEVGLNAYIYAPKDDPYHRSRWREPYDGEALARFTELLATAQENGVRLYWAISPGLSITYSDAADYAALRAKVDAMHELGVRHFALFFDDIPARLAHAADRDRYESLAEAHADLVTRLYADLRARGATLVVCPTTYTNAWGDRDYLRVLGRETPADVPFFWTGVDVAAPTFTRERAAEWGELMGRRPLVWDNFPVNDFAPWRLFLGPLRGRSADLPEVASGFVANPMNQAYASMLPLSTVAAYTRDPDGYDPDAALREGIESLYGPEVERLLLPFVDAYGDAGWTVSLFEPLYMPGLPIDVEAVRSALGAMRASLAALPGAETPRPEWRDRLVADLQPLVEQTAERFAERLRDPAYELTADTLLVYRPEAAAFTAYPIAAAPAIDGDLSDWPLDTGYGLYGAEPAGDAAATAYFRRDVEHLYVGLRVPDRELVIRPGGEAFQGSDHVALVWDTAPGEGATHLAPEDLVVLVPAPADGAPEARVRSLQFEGFMAKNIGDNRDLVFTDFLLSEFGEEAGGTGLRTAARRTPYGYTVEMALPLEGRDAVRLSLTVVDEDSSAGRARRAVQALTRQHYPTNPLTFPLVSGR